MKKLREWLKYLVPFTLAVLVFAFITQFDKTVAMFGDLFGWIVYLISRFAIAFGVAYFLNFPMRYMERRFRFKRWLSITLTYVLFFMFIAIVMMFVIPSVVESIQQILGASQHYYRQIAELLNSISLRGDLPAEALEVINGVLRGAGDGLMSYLKNLMNMDILGQFVSRSLRTVTNIGFGLFISFYALHSKEKLAAAFKRFIFSVFPRKISSDTLSVLRDADVNFSRFIIGKVMESFLIGLISLAAYLIFGLPVPVFLAILAGLSNIVPIFGPIFGTVVTGIILLGFGPMPMLIGVLICIAVQALDAAVLGPKVLGDACGLSPLMIIISITVGGDLFGLLGILLAVPVVGTLKHTVVARIIEYRLSSRGIDPDDPENPGEMDGQMEMDE